MSIEKRQAKVLGMIAFLPIMVLPSILLILVFINKDYPYLAQMMFTYILGVSITLWLYKRIFKKLKDGKISFEKTVWMIILAFLPIVISLTVIMIAFPF